MSRESQAVDQVTEVAAQQQPERNPVRQADEIAGIFDTRTPQVLKAKINR